MGEEDNQLSGPRGLYVDEDQTLFIADTSNHRIVEWKKGDESGRVVAGGNGEGNGLNQLNRPLDVLLDKESDTLIIADRENRRVMRWSRQNGTEEGEILIDNVRCKGLAMDKERNLYVSDDEKHEVRMYRMGEKGEGTLVAGGNGEGNGLNQLKDPYFIFVDEDQSVYVSEGENYRVMKWVKGAKEGVVVAGGRGEEQDEIQYLSPGGVFVDGMGTVYVADYENARVTRWVKETEKGEVIVGGNGLQEGANQLNGPTGVSFDGDGNLYVADTFKCRVQRFDIEHN